MTDLLTMLNALPAPTHAGYSAIQIPGFPNHRVGLGADMNVALLVGSTDASQSGTGQVYELRNVVVRENCLCTVHVHGESMEEKWFTVLELKYGSGSLITHFTQVIPAFLQVVGNFPKLNDVLDAVWRLVELFR